MDDQSHVWYLEESKRDVLRLMLETGALSFPPGGRRLKSGRVSPYFFDSGGLNSGKGLSVLGSAYAHLIRRHLPRKISFGDFVLFGPAYKGIPLATVTAIALFRQEQADIPVVFDRKEEKDHGEGGILIGGEILDGKRVIIVDDVITSGRAKMDAIRLIRAKGGCPESALIILDRQERGEDTNLSAVQQLEREAALPVWSLLTLGDVTEYIRGIPEREADVNAIEAYSREYGIVS